LSNFISGKKNRKNSTTKKHEMAGKFSKKWVDGWNKKWFDGLLTAIKKLIFGI
jgi:hypothetical protein